MILNRAYIVAVTGGTDENEKHLPEHDASVQKVSGTKSCSFATGPLRDLSNTQFVISIGKVE